MKNLDLDTVNPELGKIVLDVAEECDSKFCDRIVLRIPPIKFKTKIVVDGQEIEVDLSNDEALEIEEKERSELKQRIMKPSSLENTLGSMFDFSTCVFV